MDMINVQINFDWDLNLDIAAQNKTEAHDSLKVYKLKVAKRSNILYLKLINYNLPIF